MNIKDGRFDTPYEGYYAICYRTKDYEGNAYEKVVGINVGDAYDSITDFVLTDNYDVTGEVNHVLRLASKCNVFGGVIETSLTPSVNIDGINLKVYGNSSDGFYFIPKASGTYDITYTVTDYVGQKLQKTESIKVSAQVNPVIDDSVTFPEYFITDFGYVLPEATAIDKNGEKIIARIYITDGTKDNYLYEAGKKITFVPDENGKVTIRYAAGHTEKVYTVPVVKVKTDNKLTLGSFFVPSSEQITIDADSRGVKFVASNDGAVEFINKIYPEMAYAKIFLSELGINFSEFTFRLEGAAQSISLYLYEQNGEIFARLDGGSATKVAASTEEVVKIAYSTKFKGFLVNDIHLFAVTKNDRGEEFTGFESEKLGLNFVISGVEDQASVWVSHIMEQRVNSSTKSDLVKPYAVIDGTYNNVVFSSGDVVKIIGVKHCDVLSPETSCYVSFTKDGNPLTALDGTLLSNVLFTGQDFKVKLEDIGSYSLVYTVVDWNKKSESFGCRFTVLDSSVPTLDITNIKISGVLGENTVTGVKATDDSGEDVLISMSVYDPTGKRYHVSDGKFTAKFKGEYILSIMAVDKTGNIVFEEVKFNVN